MGLSWGRGGLGSFLVVVGEDFVLPFGGGLNLCIEED